MGCAHNHEFLDSYYKIHYLNYILELKKYEIGIIKKQ